jgi:hypothetical protein
MTEQTGDELYAWQEQEEDGRWGIIAVVVANAEAAQPIPLVTRSFSIAAAMRPMAEAHEQSSGHVVRLGCFELTRTVVETP